MTDSRIKLLPDHVANQIAAGEVVQRPASVVKELMENALDAGADDIKLIVKDGGKTLIQVVDNGSGMNEIDARMAFERHATSKITDAEDLFHLQTKGFRGEALASIAAVAHVEMKTKPEDAELGTFIKIEGSKIITQEPVAAQKGTSIAVKNLFYNIPARRKFLKSVKIEMRHINEEFFRIALAHPQISLTLIHNGNTQYSLPKSNRLQRISNLFGHKMQTKLVPLQESTDYIKIDGYIGKPESVKLKRGEQYFFVNNRFIKSPYLHHALMSAYEGLIKDKSYPAYFIYFEIDPKHIDVNIHPTKTEIKFDDEQTVYSILKVAAKHSLGQFNLSPSMDFDNRPDLDIPYEMQKQTPKMPDIKVNPDFNPFEEDEFGQPAKTPMKHYEKKLDYWESLMHQAETDAGNLFEQQETHSSLNEENQREIESFQFQNKFIITHRQNRLLMIHQHRAHRLVLYHRMLSQLKKGHIPSQQLIFPVELHLSSVEINLLKDYEQEIKNTGFDVEFADESILINGVPLEQKTLDITEIFQEIIGQLQMEAPAEKTVVEKKLANIVARKSAIKTGQKLTQEEIKALIRDLFSIPENRFTPEGKVIIVEIDTGALERKFM